MEAHFFLEKSILKKLILIIYISYLASPVTCLVLTAILVILLFLFRKPDLDIEEKSELDKSILITPTSGKIKKINTSDMCTVEMKIPFWSGYGLCMPISGEISQYIEEYETRFNFLGFKIQKINQLIEFTSDIGFSYKIKISNFNIGKKESSVWVRPGDIAQRGAYLGYLPFGGNIAIELPRTCEMVAKQDDYLMAGNTVFAINRG